MRRFIVTEKDVIEAEINNFGEKCWTTFRYNDDVIIGKAQLVCIIRQEAELRIKEKYLQDEAMAILKEIVLVKPTIPALRKIMKYVKFKRISAQEKGL